MLHRELTATPDATRDTRKGGAPRGGGSLPASARRSRRSKASQRLAAAWRRPTALETPHEDVRQVELEEKGFGTLERGAHRRRVEAVAGTRLRAAVVDVQLRDLVQKVRTGQELLRAVGYDRSCGGKEAHQWDLTWWKGSVFGGVDGKRRGKGRQHRGRGVL
jgi:hypothetical protein